MGWVSCGMGHLEVARARGPGPQVAGKTRGGRGTALALYDVMKVSRAACHAQFVVLDGVHVDRQVFASLERWASDRGLQPQDAIQLALCRLHDSALARATARPQARHVR